MKLKRGILKNELKEKIFITSFYIEMEYVTRNDKYYTLLNTNLFRQYFVKWKIIRFYSLVYRVIEKDRNTLNHS